MFEALKTFFGLSPHDESISTAEKIYDALDAMARRRGTSMADILREAVALEKWVEDELEEGRRAKEQRQKEKQGK